MESVNQKKNPARVPELVKIMNDLVNNNLRLYNIAVKHTTDMELLAKMYHNQELSTKMLNHCTTIYTDIGQALSDYKNRYSDCIIIHILDLDLYAVFTYEKYSTFLTSIKDGITDEKITKDDLKLYQIVLSGQRQKLVFAITNLAYFDKMKDYISECFNNPGTKVDSILINDQITINIYANSEKELEDMYVKLNNYIYQRNDKKCASSMRRSILFNAGSDQYRAHDCSDVPETDDMTAVYKILKTVNIKDIQNLNLTVNINNSINGSNIITGKNNTIQVGVNPADQKKLSRVEADRSARLWIQNNQHGGSDESTRQYYDRYEADNAAALLSLVDFNKLMREILGRDVKHGTGGMRHW